ncbi:hypothetical protein SAMN06265222_101292 [Neorhodopirellula lusitana]|uniref:UPF0246 protein SAMN06265222_101292 n=1 Tax=Neorhodopirellula lusitana TaxID=445327 RepID=A0ABY1PPV1_9BACT|nr:peroxide stress protein YaaA [Neorhodopirellula lusitana]SMP39307.1 hypothetical protein SAMN06265222_101292 [Neorhodopirellula lusitana]
MLIVLSPAKTMDFESAVAVKMPALSKSDQKPALIKHSVELAQLLKTQTPDDLRRMMGISEALAELNHARFQDWESPHPSNGSKEALFAFQGDVYQGLNADSFTPKQLEVAQNQIRILSGLYGVLRPLDRILPYRLEMGTSLANAHGKDLYAFWGNAITQELAKQMEINQSRFLLNLASHEYFRSVKRAQLPAPVVAPAFKENKNGKYKIISFFAKKARGTMAAWVIRNRVRTLDKLTQFAEDDYRYDADSSTDKVPVFLRG